MKGRLAIVLTFTIASLVAVGFLLTRPEMVDTSDWTAWRMSKGQLAFQVPSDWSVEQRDGGTMSTILIFDELNEQRLEIRYIAGWEGTKEAVTFVPSLEGTNDAVVRTIIGGVATHPDAAQLETARSIP